jgi:uncharacterized membrane protein YdfJ with MMPL/SSD domain
MVLLFLFTGSVLLPVKAVASVPILVGAIAFGLSVDYEVFLLSRIREEWLARGTRGARSRSAYSAPAASSPPRRW